MTLFRISVTQGPFGFTQKFNHDGEEIDEWIAEKLKLLPYGEIIREYKDPRDGQYKRMGYK